MAETAAAAATYTFRLPHSSAHFLTSPITPRGDRNLNKVVRKAWSLGCKFDHWKEQFSYKLWEQAFTECSIDGEFYLRERGYGEILPWDHLDYGCSKEGLSRIYRQAENGD